MVALYDSAWVAAEVDRCAAMWRACGAHPEDLTAEYSLRDHESRELAYDISLREVEGEAKRATRNASDRRAAEQRMIASFARFAQNALDLDGLQIGLLTDDFIPVGIEFARRARAFDPDLSREDTIQACRNAWTACGLQPLLGAPCEVTPAILGYSLLYPYTDNYLDSAAVPASAKLTFSARFRNRLRGQVAPIVNERERAVWALVEMIEAQFPRANFPAVFACLLAIHQAQEDSLAQGNDQAPLDDAKLMRLSLAKGGTSVLADACLVRGEMTPDEARVAFEWGALLQLGDDLQDLREDRSHGSVTVFTRALDQGESLDALVHQLLAFCRRASAHMDALPGGPQALKDLLRSSWRSLVIAAIAKAHEFFSPAFLQQAERCSPFRFDFLRRRRRRLAARQGTFTVLFDRFVEEEAIATPPAVLRQRGVQSPSFEAAP
jgi:hypothetical protein